MSRCLAATAVWMVKSAPGGLVLAEPRPAPGEAATPTLVDDEPLTVARKTARDR